jgi:hypothetical protein
VAAKIDKKDALAVETEGLHFRALSVGASLAFGLLGRGLKGPQPPNFLHHSLGIEFVLEALERAVNGFSFANDYFWHDVLLLGSEFLGL